MDDEEIQKFGAAKTEIPEEYQDGDFQQRVITAMSRCL